MFNEKATQDSGILLDPQGNVAPLRPDIVHTRPQPQTSQIDEHFDKLDKQLERRHENAWRSDFLLWLRTLLVYTGNHLLMPRSYGFGFDLIPINADDPVYIQNKLRFYSDDVTNSWGLSNPVIDIVAIAEADDEKMRATRAARAANNHYNRVHFTEQWKQMIAKLAQFCGNYHVDVFFDPAAAGAKAKTPVVGQSELPGADIYTCGDCGMVGEGAMPHCPDCGSDRVVNESVPAQPISTVTGYEMKDAGDIQCLVIPPWQLRYERGDLPERSGWIRRSRDIPVETLQHLFPDREIKATTSDDESLHPDRTLRRSVQSITKGSVYGQGEGDEHYTEFVEFWYEPEMYSKVILKADEQLADGRTAKAGAKLIDLFPKGIYRATIRGLSGTVIMREESHRKRLVSGQFILVPGRGVGDNIKDALEYQRQANLLTSIEFQAYRKAATPTLIVNSRMIRQSQLATKPGAVLTVNQGDIPEGQSVNNAFAVIPATVPNAQMINYEQRLDAGLQTAIKSLTMSSGLPGVNNTTATGARIGEAKAQQARTSELALLAEFYKKIATLRLELMQQHFTDERMIHFVGKNGEMEAASFKGADIQSDFILWVRGTSYMPNSPLIRQANLQAAIEAIGALKSVGYDSPQALRLINETFDVELSGEAITTYSDWGRKAINVMMAAVPDAEAALPQLMAGPQAAVDPMTGEMVAVDPMAQLGKMVGATVEVDAYELGHEHKLLWLREWLTNDEGQRAHPLLRAGAHDVIDRLTEAMAMVQQKMAMMQLQAAAPMMQAQAAQAQATQVTQSQPKERERRDKAMDNRMPGLAMPPGLGGAASPLPQIMPAVMAGA